MPIRRTILDQLSGTVRSMLAREVPERVLFLTGEAGIGKSTLIRQLLVNLDTDAKPPIVATAECSTPVAGSNVGHVEALKPFADVMSGLVEAGAQHEKKNAKGKGTGKTAGKDSGTGTAFKLDVGKFFVDTAPSWIGLIPVIGGPIFHALSIVGSGYDQVYLHNKIRSEHANSASNQEQVFRQYINFLSKLSEHAPVLIVIDDFHWADTSSTNLLFAAARDLSASSVVFLVAYREDAIKRSANQDEHPILHVRNEIERYALSRHIDVPPADQTDLRALLLETYPAYEPNIVLEQWLLRISDGNLLFATQFLMTLDQDQYLEPKTALVLKDLASVPVPSSANAIVVEHIRRLSDDEKEHLRYTSVEGETFTTHMASRILDMPMLKVIPRLRLLADRLQVIRLLGTQTLYAKETTAYQFVHFLVHKALYDDLLKEERILLHGLVADVLEEELIAAEEAQHNVHIVATRLAAHATVAERYQRAAEAYLKGAQWVWKSYSADESLNLIDQCIQTVQAQKTASQALRSVGLDALLLKADINFHCGRNADAVVIYEEAITLANDIGTPAQRSEAYLSLSNMKFPGGHYAEAETIARVALQIATEANETLRCGHALNNIGSSYNARRMYDQALDYYEQSMQAAVTTGDELGRASSLIHIGNVYSMRGNHTVALEHNQVALSVYRSRGDTHGIMACLTHIGCTLAYNNMFESALENFEEALKLARLIGGVRWEASILTNMSSVKTDLGHYGEALELAQSGLAILEQIGDRHGIAFSYNILGAIYLHTYRFDDALGCLQKGITLATEIGDPLRVAVLNRLTGFMYLVQSRYAEALQLYETCRHEFAELGIKSSQIASAIGAAWCSLKLEALETAGASIIKSSDLLSRTQSLVREEDFTMLEYESQSTAWLKGLSKFGITLAE